MPNWLKNSNVQKVFKLLAQNGGEGRIVGGAVRDHLLGVAIGDIDFCSTHTPAQLMEVAQSNGIRYIETGVNYGTLTLILGKQLFEVTALRQDVETDGRHAKVIYGTSFKLDAMRRDFTMNALYMDADGQIFDPLNTGIEDLKNRKIKFIGNAKQRIEEDYLRILRYFRFIARFDLLTDETDYSQIPHLVSGLGQLSAERILAEFKRLFESEFLIRALQLMTECKIFDQIFKSSIQLNSLSYLQNTGLSNDNIWLIRFRLSFPNLSVKNIASILKISNKDQKILNQMNHLPDILAMDEQDLFKNVYVWGAEIVIDNLIHFAAETNFKLSDLKAKISTVEQFEIPVFPVKGGDLFALGLKAGPTMGQQIKQLEAHWLEHNFKPTKTELLALVI